MSNRAHPLQWPPGWPRTDQWSRKSAPYKVSLDQAVAATHHPDKGGDTVTFGQLTQAFHEALSGKGAT